MRAVTLGDLKADLHSLVDLLCAAPAEERPRVLARLRRRGRLVLLLQEYLEETALEPEQAPSPEPDQQLPTDSVQLPVLEGPLMRLRNGGLLLHREGDHRVEERSLVEHRLQHGDLVRAIPEVQGFRYELIAAGPLITRGALRDLGCPVALDSDLAVVRLQNGHQVLISRREMESLGATADDVLTVSYLPESNHEGRYLGRIVDVHPTEAEAEPANGARNARPRKRERAEAQECSEALPHFQPICGRQPVVVMVGGHPQSRAKYEHLIPQYGAELRWLPYSPRVRQIRTAVAASDIVIGFPMCSRTGHWKTALDAARDHKRLLFYGESENESGLRYQLETEIIPQWNAQVSGQDSA